MKRAENQDSKKKTHAEDDVSVSKARQVPIGDGEVTSRSEESAPEDKVEAVTETDPVQVLEAKVAELDDQRLRALAEMDNYRKRMTRQFEEVVRSANERLLSELLEVADNFERAIAHTNDQDKVDATRLAALKEGTELIYGQLCGLLERYDVKPFEALGRPFDPNYHDALAHIDSETYDEGIVAAEISRGYMIGERVLRHARVAVSKGQPGKDENKKDAQKSE